jgi:hypothetical protein
MCTASSWISSIRPTRPAPCAPARHALLLELAHELFRTGAKRVVTRFCLEAATLARDIADANALAQAALGLGSVFPPWVDDDARTAVELLREALEGLDESAHALRAQVRSRLAGWLTWSAPGPPAGSWPPTPSPKPDRPVTEGPWRRSCSIEASCLPRGPKTLHGPPRSPRNW